MDKWQVGPVGDCTGYDMADGHEDVVSYEEEYSQKVVFVIGTDNFGSDLTNSVEESPTSLQQTIADLNSSHEMDTSRPDHILDPDDTPTPDTKDPDEKTQDTETEKKNETTNDDTKKTILGQDTPKASAKENTEKNENHNRDDVPIPETVSTPSIPVSKDGDQEKEHLSGDNPRKEGLTDKERMAIYEERERQFTEDFLSTKPIPPDDPSQSGKDRPNARTIGRSRSTSPHPGIGLGLLGNLVRLLDHLSNLKEQNQGLRRKCIYLEHTKSLLYVHNVMLKSQGVSGGSPKVRGRFKSSMKSGTRKSLQHQHISDGGLIGYSHFDSDSSDEEVTTHEPTSSRNKLNKLTQRSQSVGSINVDLVDIDLTLGTAHVTRHKTTVDKHSKDVNRFEAMFSKSKISSKWERVKKVFSGKPEQSPKSEPATITAEQLVRANSKYTRAPSLLQMGQGASTTDPNDQPTRVSTSPGSPSLGSAEPSSPVSVEGDHAIPSVIADDQDTFVEPSGSVGTDLFTDGEGLASGGSSGEGTSDGRPSPRRDTKPPTTAPVTDEEKCKSNFLSVKQSSLKRRQSSPTLCLSDESDAASTEKGHDSLEPPRSPSIKRSSSFKVTKSNESFNDVSDDASSRVTTPKTPESRKSHKSAWGRVKDIIHTRKDSLKRKNKRSNSAGDMLPDATTVEGFYDYCSKSDAEDMCDERFDGGDISPRSASPRLTRKNSSKAPTTPSPHPSPPHKRRHESPPKTKKSDHIRSPPSSPPICKKEASSPQGRPSTSPGPLDMTALMGGVSEEFTKKIQEWEEKKRRSFIKENSINLDDEARESSDAARFTEEFIRKMEEWEKMKGLGSPPRVRTSREGTTQSPDLCTPPEQTSQSQSMEDLQKHLSESFSKTVQEWERIKTQRTKDTGSPVSDITMRPPEKRSRKTERSKSRERDRSRSKYDKQRERGRQKIEKKEQKLEKERQKLERMRQKLEGIETMSEVHVEGVSQEFARKLYEWEVMKGLRQEQPAPSGGEDSTIISSTETSFMLHASQTTHTRSQSAKAYKEYMNERRERTQSESQVDGLGSGSGSQTPSEGRRSEGTNARSASVPSVRSTTALVDDSTSIDLNLTTQESPSDQTKKLLDDLTRKEDELAAMQHEVQQLTERISAMDIEHNSQIEHFKRELWASSQLGRYTIETDLVSASVSELRLKVDQLTDYQQKLIRERDQLQIQMEREMTARQAVEARLITQLRQPSPPQGSQHQQAIESVQDFDKLCEFFLKLWSQLNELRLGVLERNNLLADMQHHVLRQEVANRLMAADMASRDLQLSYLQGARKRGILGRSHTFSGRDHITRERTKHSSAHRFLTCHHAMFEYAIGQLHHGNTDATQVDWEWLERLRAQRASAIGRIQGAVSMANHEAQTDPGSSDHLMSDSSAQTVMTLCNIPYSSPPVPREVRLLPAAFLSNKSVQANVPQQARSPPVTPVKMLPAATSTPIKPVSTAKDDIQTTHNNVNPECGRPQLIRQKRTENPLTPTKPKTEHGETKATTSFTFISSSEQLKKEFMSRDYVTEISTKTATQTSQPSAPLGEGDTSDTSTRGMPDHGEKVGASSDTAAPIASRHTGPWVRRFGATSDPEDMSAPTSHPPHSPIIRSRNPRKLKAENKAYSQQCTDSRTWKATPPKRMHRHRRPSTEKRPSVTSDTDTDGPSSPTLPHSGNLPTRGRSKEDCYSDPPTPRSLSVPPRDNVMYDLCFRDHYTPHYTQREIKPVVVHDMISKFESSSASSQAGCCSGNRSPSPAIRKPVVSPVRRLKTAAELMHGSEPHRQGTQSSSQTRASSISPAPRSISSMSSDKENDKTESCVHHIVHRLSRESTPDISVGATGGIPVSEAPTAHMVKQVVRRLSESSIEGPKTALKDLTNGNKVKKMSDTFRDRPWSPERSDLRQRPSPSKNLPSNKKRYELPKDGQVSKYTTVFEDKGEKKEVATGPMSSPSPSSLKTSVTHQDPKTVIAPQQLEKPSRELASSSMPTLQAISAEHAAPISSRPRPKSQQTTTLPAAVPAQQGATGGSGARDLKTKLFGRKSSKSSAISVLCKQVVSVEVDDSPDRDEAKRDSLPRSPEGLRKDGSLEKGSRARRFLDTNWLQKPKRFFKVSK